MKRLPSLKALLREEAIPALTAERPYFSTLEVRTWLSRRRVSWSVTTLNSYLHVFTNEGFIHDAGRGWYSTLAKRLELDRSHVAPVVSLIEEAFPLLEFAVWSTQQINPWMHHLLSKFVTFVHVEKEGLSPVWELLKEKGYDAHRNPTKKEIAKTFAVRDNTVVVRVGSPAQAPVDGHFAMPEKVLVDLAAEVALLPLMDAREFTALFSSAAVAGRMEINAMLRYSSRKELKDNFLSLVNQLTSQNSDF